MSMTTTGAAKDPAASAAWAVVAAGIIAALHVGKLPPAIAALHTSLGISLVEAGFLLSMVQAAGMLGGVMLGSAADGIGLRRSMAAGLSVLAVASACGGFVRDSSALLLLRAAEGLGFLLVVLPAPGMLRALLPPASLGRALGVWGAYMPLGTALALLTGPVVIDAIGWRGWWWGLAGASIVMLLVLLRCVPPQPRRGAAAVPAALARLRSTLGALGPWLVAASFAAYSAQWMAVIGFLPSIYLESGLSSARTAVFTAVAAAANVVGNVMSGRLLQRGVHPVRLLRLGFSTMGLAAVAAFAGAGDAGLPPALRYLAVVLFSMLGGLVPATLFALAVKLAPGEQTVSTTVGWVQQWSAFGQFAGPPLAAFVAARAGGWHWNWAATGACAAAGLALSLAIARRPGVR
jgi:MFS family permease